MWPPPLIGILKQEPQKFVAYGYSKTNTIAVCIYSIILTMFLLFFSYHFPFSLVLSAYPVQMFA